MGAYFFSETQRMIQREVAWALVLILAAAEAGAVCCYVFQIGDQPLPLWALLIISAFLAALCLMALFMRLSVEVYGEHITIRTLRARVISKSEIKECRVAGYNALRDYGGWGIRYWTRGKGYIVPGSEGGVEIFLKGRDRGILIASRRPEELLSAIRGCGKPGN
jgi:hypothetical protein